MRDSGVTQGEEMAMRGFPGLLGHCVPGEAPHSRRSCRGSGEGATLLRGRRTEADPRGGGPGRGECVSVVVLSSSVPCLWVREL